jgi:hypothetical protein
MDSPLQGAYPLASGYRYVGELHAIRNPYYTLRGNDEKRLAGVIK